MGEAVKKLPAELKESHKDVNWKEVAGMRDVLIHEYFGVDYEIVWSVVKYDIPELKDQLEQIKDL
ncbi:MAG: HepT-like ribonuclease domain-containing protein [bacterium]